MLRVLRFGAFALIGIAALVAPAVASSAVVSNGSFETADFSGWQTQDTPGGDWVIFSAGSVIAVTVAAPPLGNHAAVAVQQSTPSRQILYQDVTVPPRRFRSQLSLFAFYQAHTAIVSPDTLALAGTNEQYRIDVMRPSAALDSVSPGDVLATVFRTQTGAQSFLGATRVTADLSRYAGQVVRLRCAVAASDGTLNGGVDVVAVTGLDLGKVKPSGGGGTARLPVTVTDPGTVKISGREVKRRSVAVSRGTVKLLVRPKGRAERVLSAAGSAKVKAKVIYTPNGAAAQTEKVRVRLVRS